MHRRSMLWTFLTILAVPFAAAGCGGGPAVGHVSGVVTLQGKPLQSGTIGFIAADGRPYQADLQTDGTYRVDNVPVGEAIIVVNPKVQEDASRMKAIKEKKGEPPPPVA